MRYHSCYPGSPTERQLLLTKSFQYPRKPTRIYTCLQIVQPMVSWISRDYDTLEAFFTALAMRQLISPGATSLPSLAQADWVISPVLRIANIIAPCPASIPPGHTRHPVFQSRIPVLSHFRRISRRC